MDTDEDDYTEKYALVAIRMTSMPAFQPTVDDQKLWEITAFVTQKLGKITPEEYTAWSKKYTQVNNDSTKQEKFLLHR